MFVSIYHTYKTVIHFLLRFFGVYAGLSWAYFLYLSAFANQSDIFTIWVGKLSQLLIGLFGFEARVVSEPGIPNLQLYINETYVARIIEGCNAASILILFVSFVVAYSGKTKPMLLFLMAGILLIFGINILRIVILSIILFKFPQHSEWMHQLVFPGIIYGFTVLLWLVWILKFSKK